MKKFGARKAYLVCMVIMSVFVSILSGCGGGGGGSWTQPGAGGSPTARPTVTSSVPSKSTPVSIVQPSTAVTVTFDKVMDPATITTGTFTLTGPGGIPVPPAATPVTYDAASKTVTFHPLAALATGTYTATIKGTGVNAAKDSTGNALAGDSLQPLVANDYVWNFTTSLTAPALRPTVTTSVPAKIFPVPTVLPGTAVTATFDKVMDVTTITTGTFTLTGPGGIPVPPAATPVTYSVASKTVTFHPAAATLAIGNYTATIKGTGVNAAKDSTGNALAGISTQPLVANDYVWSFTVAAVIPPVQPLAINLGRAASFGIASRAGLTSTGVTVVNGNIALSPLATCTDATGNAGASQSCLSKIYSSPTGMAVNGSIFWAGDPFDSGVTADGVTTDLTAAWNEGMAKVNTQPAIAAGEIGGKTFIPGTYENANLTLAAGAVATLDAQNDPNAVFIFKTTLGGDFVDSGTLLLPSRIVLLNQAQAKNVWFVIGRDATIGSGTNWSGNILANRTVTLKDGSTVLGRVLGGAGGAGAITLTGAASPSLTTITVP